MVADRLRDALLALQGLLERGPCRRLEDLFLERVVESWWRIAGGRTVEKGFSRRDGAAVRRAGRLDSSDATDRVSIARLLRIPPPGVPTLTLPDPPPPPDPREWTARLDSGCWTLRWRWRWAAVVRRDSAAPLRRPPLLEVEAEDGQRALMVLPPEGAWYTPHPTVEGRGSPPRGRQLTLLAPPVAAALIHEVVGHTLEGDLVVAGLSPLRGGAPQYRFAFPLEVSDDPSRADLPGSFDLDDEGVPARTRTLLQAGEVVGVLADRAAAARLYAPSGNARRGSVHSPPGPRVSNLITRGPGLPLVQLRRRARVEVTSVRAANFNIPSATVRLEVRSAHTLRSGERHRPLPSFTLQAPLAAVCAGLLACSLETATSAEPGWCRKDGDAVPVGNDTPWLLLDALEALG